MSTCWQQTTSDYHDCYYLVVIVHTNTFCVGFSAP